MLLLKFNVVIVLFGQVSRALPQQLHGLHPCGGHEPPHLQGLSPQQHQQGAPSPRGLIATARPSRSTSPAATATAADSTTAVCGGAPPSAGAASWRAGEAAHLWQYWQALLLVPRHHRTVPQQAHVTYCCWSNYVSLRSQIRYLCCGSGSGSTWIRIHLAVLDPDPY